MGGSYSGLLWDLLRCYGAPIPGLLWGSYSGLLWDRATLRCYGRPTPLLFPTPLLWGLLLWGGGVRAPLRCYHGSHSVVISPTPLLWGLLLWGLRAPLCCYDVRPPRVGGQHPVTSYLLRPRPARLCCPLSAGVRRKRARPYTPLYYLQPFLFIKKTSISVQGQGASRYGRGKVACSPRKAISTMFLSCVAGAWK